MEYCLAFRRCDIYMSGSDCILHRGRQHPESISQTQKYHPLSEKQSSTKYHIFPPFFFTNQNIVMALIIYFCKLSYIFMDKSRSSNNSRSLRTKYVAKRTEIDQSLFGIKPNKHPRNDEQLRKVTAMVKQKNYNHPEISVLNEKDLQRMKETIRKPTKQELEREKKLAQEEKQYKLALAKAKREEMLRLEEEKKKKLPMNPFQKQQLDKRTKINQRAIEHANEHIDEVKEMNKMVAYAKAATIRERQLDEKKRDWESFKTQEKKKDKIMEIERLRKIQEQQEIQRAKKEQAIRGRAVIVDQIKQREIQRLKQKEEQERQAQILVHKMKEMQLQEQRKIQKKKEQQHKMNEQIVKANKNAQLVIQQRKEKEKQEEEKIVAYIKEKADKEAELIAEQKRIKDEKQKQIQRLRELQEKASDRQAELDALRAKRAAEANQRAAREKERIQAEIRAKRAQQLQAARYEQQKEREKMLAEQARAQKKQFQNVIQKQKEMRELEEKLQQERKQLLKKHADDLKKQIVEKGEQKHLDNKVRQVENQQLQQTFQGQRALIQKIKQDKIKELQGLNIPSKYIVQLQNKKIH